MRKNNSQVFMNTIAFFINDISNVGGTQKVVSTLSRGLVSGNPQTKVVIYSLRVSNEFALKNLHQNVEVINLDENFNKLGIIRAIIKINRLNRKMDVNVVIGIGVYFSVFLPFIFGVKTIAAEHNSYNIVSDRTCFVRKIAYRFVSAVVSLTNYDKFFYQKINPMTFVIPNPLELRGDLGNIKRTNSIAAVGTLTKRKGFSRLLNIWSKVDSSNHYTLDIYGDGEEEDCLKLQSKELGLNNVFFHGNVNNIEERLLKSKLLVMTSFVEGFPMVLLEAMDAGLPCIAYDIRTGPCEIISNGNNGFLIQDGNEDEFVAALNNLIVNESILIKMSENAKKSAGEFELKEIVRKWNELISSL